MTDAVDRHHNAPPLADQLELAYSVTQLAEDHADLAAEAEALCERARDVTEVNDTAGNEAASALVIALRDMAQRVDREHDAIKKPVWDAGKNVDLFFNGVNNSDSKRPGPVSAQKLRLERLIRDHAFKVAEEQREAARRAAEAERAKAAAAAEAARQAEAANKVAVADVILESGIKAEEMAEHLEDRAAGPVQDLARVRTAVATSGLRAVPGFDILDPVALRASLGVLGQSFTPDAIGAAIRKFRGDSEAFKKWEFRDDDQHAQRRVVVAKPELPGVEFFVSYAGSVRA